MDLHLFAQLNLIGHISYESYLNMEREEAEAIYKALKHAITQSQAEAQPAPNNGFDDLCRRYGG